MKWGWRKMFFSPSPSVSNHSFCQIFIIMSNFSDACFPVFVEIENKHISLFQMIILKNFFMTGVLYFFRVSILIFTSVSISLPRSYTVLEITASPSFTKTSIRFGFTYTSSSNPSFNLGVVNCTL